MKIICCKSDFSRASIWVDNQGDWSTGTWCTKRYMNQVVSTKGNLTGKMATFGGFSRNVPQKEWIFFFRCHYNTFAKLIWYKSCHFSSRFLIQKSTGCVCCFVLSNRYRGINLRSRGFFTSEPREHVLTIENRRRTTSPWPPLVVTLWLPNHCFTENPRQNGRKMTSFRGATAKLGACVDNELGGLAPHQCR